MNKKLKKIIVIATITAIPVLGFLGCIQSGEKIPVTITNLADVKKASSTPVPSEPEVEQTSEPETKNDSAKAEKEPVIDPQSIADMEELLNAGKIQSSGFGTKAVSGILNISGTTKGSYIPDNKAIHAKGFENGTVYSLKMSSSQPLWAYMFKMINNKWVFSRLINSTENITFKGGAIDFTELYIGYFMTWKSAYYSSAIEKVSSSNPLNVNFQGQYLLKDNLGLISRYNGKYNVNNLDDLRGSACAPTSCAILVDYYGKKKKVSINDEAVYLFEKFGTTNYTGGGTSSTSAVNVLHSQYGFNASYYGWPNSGQFDTKSSRTNMWNTIISEINQGRPVIFRSRSIPGYGGGGHYMLIIGYNKNNNTVITNDPGRMTNPESGKGKVYNFSDIANTNAGIITVQ